MNTIAEEKKDKKTSSVKTTSETIQSTVNISIISDPPNGFVTRTASKICSPPAPANPPSPGSTVTNMQTTISPRPTGHEHSDMMMTIGSEGDQSFPYFTWVARFSSSPFSLHTSILVPTLELLM
ncbi:hypothetical protein GE21DRAFT_1289753 [Neurospora crassa]|nr:hypothetical protein GE21DRAFT_1289753 [Neurospora crassa]